jgi:SprB repeat
MRKQFHLILLVFVALFVQNLQAQQQQLYLQLNSTLHNDYNISCFGGRDGVIDLTIYNGTAPFTVEWSTSATTEDLSDLSAGYYHVSVTDINHLVAEAEVNLSEPPPFEPGITLTKYVFPNGFNTSCYFCSDGLITLTVESGIAPFSFQWTDGAVTQDRTGIHKGDYEVIISDANGCTVNTSTTLTAPGRDDWTMSGNTGSDPSLNFIGTTDLKDFSIKTNSLQRLLINQSGTVKVNSLSGAGTDVVFADYQGNLMRGPSFFPYWTPFGNFGIGATHFIGTRNNADLIFKTDVDNATQFTPCGLCGERMRIKANGQVGIGVNNIIGTQILTVAGNTYLDGKLGIGDS